jgi:hypothetical protein
VKLGDAEKAATGRHAAGGAESARDNIAAGLPNSTRTPQVTFEAQLANRREKPGDFETQVCIGQRTAKKITARDVEVSLPQMPEHNLALTDHKSSPGFRSDRS